MLSNQYSDFYSQYRANVIEAAKIARVLYPEMTKLLDAEFTNKGLSLMITTGESSDILVVFVPFIFLFNEHWQKLHQVRKKREERKFKALLIKSRKEQITRALDLAIQWHGTQTYGDLPYVYHLNQVRNVAKRFPENLTAFEQHLLDLAAIFHDIFEDTKIPVELIRDFSQRVFEICWRVTDEAGDNRKIRKAKTYLKIVEDDLAIHLKLCDRIANVEENIRTKNHRKFEMYLKEQEGFKLALYKPGVAEEKWNYLEKLFAEGIKD